MGFAERFPRPITALIGLLLLLLTAAIVALEILSVYKDIGHGTIWAGLWSALVFIPTILAMLIITCCCRGRYCAFYVLIFVVASGALAVVIIYFAQAHISNVCKCYLGDKLCCALKGVPEYQSNFESILERCGILAANNTQNIDTCTASALSDKVVYLKAQLGCAAGLLATCALYVLLFLFACFGICFGHD